MTIGDTNSNNGGTWNQDDTILFVPAASSGIFRVNAAGGMSARVTQPDAAEAEVSHWQPFFLPDGRHFLFHITSSRSQPGGGVYLGTADGTAKPRLLVQGGSNAQYAVGHVLFLRDSTLMAQKFDPDRLELQGDAVPVAEQVLTGGATGRTGAFSVSQTGVLVYQAGAGLQGSRLKWRDRAGKETGILGDVGDYGDVELSPDGSRVALSVLDPAVRTRDIWIFDVKRGLRTRFTFGPGDEVAPIWSPDGSKVVYSSRGSGAVDLIRKLATGSGGEEKLKSDGTSNVATSWSPDGRSILSTTAGGGGTTDIWLVPTSGDAKAKPFLQTPAIETSSRYSPDGRWVAYTTNEAGRNDIYVMSATGQAGKWLVSTAGGFFPRWRGDSKELFYLSIDGKLMAAQVNGQPSGFEVGVVQALFEAHAKTGLRNPYDVTADGQRVLINANEADPTPEPLTLVVNWTAALRR